MPQNYRGITITNSIEKLFNTILNDRLDRFLVENNIIHESPDRVLSKIEDVRRTICF